MTIPKSIQGDYHHWHNFLDAEVQFSLADSEKHTKEHCARVLLFALLIAVKMYLPHEEREVLCAAAVFHDARRQDDWLDVGHGQRAADYYRAYCRTHPLVFDERAYESMFQGLVRKYNKHHKPEEALPNITPHTMRHTFCTRLAHAGMNPKDLQYITGHSNITMTLNYYAHADYASAKAAMDRLAA